MPDRIGAWFTKTLAVCAGAMLAIGPVSSIAVTKTWTGASMADAHWSRADNWSPGGAPVDGDDLVFPDAAARKTNNNDLPVVSIDSMTFSGGNYLVQGNAISLVSGLSTTGPAGSSNELKLPLLLAASQTFTLAASQTLTLSGPIGESGEFLALTLQSAGSTTVVLTSTASHRGGTRVVGPKLIVDGVIGRVELVSGVLGGTGVTGPVRSTFGAATLAPGNGIGLLQTDGNVELGKAATLQVELGGSGVGQSDRVKASGFFGAGGSSLAVTLVNGFVPALDVPIKIVDDPRTDRSPALRSPRAMIRSHNRSLARPKSAYSRKDRPRALSRRCRSRAIVRPQAPAPDWPP